MTTAPQAPMADVGEMYPVHTMLHREFSLAPDLIRGADRNDAKRGHSNGPTMLAHSGWVRPRLTFPSMVSRSMASSNGCGGVMPIRALLA